ncbi:MAG: hypothetical protein M3N68_01605 [Actinomycetota bacterium]|nr:hypothetical protein [Actinomycetota bacterium]
MSGRTPPALVLSCALGAVGVVLFLFGSVVHSEGAFVAGAAAGALSLGAALYWRSELVSSWADRKRRGGPDGPTR